MALQKSFKVRDFRDKGFFMVDDAYLNGYAKELGITATSIYFVLCRCADKDQIAFPSQDYIAEKLGIHSRTVRRNIKLLSDWKIIKIKQIRNHKGHFLHNTYYLLDKSEWLPTSAGHPCPTVNGRTPVSTTGGHPCPHKDTHNKDTHTLSIAENRKRTSLKKITEDDLTYIAEYYNVPLAFVKSKYDDLINYCERTGRSYKDYVAALRNFVKKDAMELKKNSMDKSLII
jgi:hypothetical protein